MVFKTPHIAVGDTIRRALAVSGAGQALDLQCHQSAVKPIISRSRSASELRA